MKLSIILPSLFPTSLDRALHNIEDATAGDHEIIVVSPFPVTGDKIRWVKEEAPLGSSGAQAFGVHHATGDIVVALSDDRIVVPHWDSIAVQNFTRREAAHFDAHRAGPFCLGLRHSNSPEVNTVFGLFFPAFPMMRRADVARIGWFDPIFYSGWGDVDLGLRVWKADGRCEWSEPAVIVYHSDDLGRPRAVEPMDMKNFLIRWAPVYGNGWPLGRMEEFVINVDPAFVARFVDGNSIKANDPAFAEVARHVSTFAANDCATLRERYAEPTFGSELVGETRDYNLVSAVFRVGTATEQSSTKKYYAIAKSMGPVDLFRERLGERELPGLIFANDTLEGVIKKAKITEREQAAEPTFGIELVGETQDYNIVAVDFTAVTETGLSPAKKYYAIAKALGPLYLFRERLGEREIPGHVLVSETLEAAIEKAKAIELEAPAIRLEDHLDGYNIIGTQSGYLALAQSLGPIDLFQEKIGERELAPVLLKARTYEEIRQKIVTLTRGGRAVHIPRPISPFAIAIESIKRRLKLGRD